MSKVPVQFYASAAGLSKIEDEDQFGTERALAIDVEKQQQYVENIEMLGFDPYDKSGLTNAMALPFHIVNQSMSFFLAGFFYIGLLLLMGLGCIGIIGQTLLEYTPLKQIFQPGYDFPSALSIIQLVIAFRLPQILADNAISFAQPQQSLLRMQHLVSQIARKLALVQQHHSIPRDKITRTKNLFNQCFDRLIAINTYTLRMFLLVEDVQEEVFSKQLKASIKTWNFAKDQIPETVEALTSDMLADVEGLISMGVYSAEELSNLRENTNELGEIMRSIKEGRMIVNPDVFQNFIKLALTVYIVIVLPLTIYASVKEYMPAAYPLIVGIIFGTPYYKWWIGGPFDDHSRFAGIHYYRWRAETYVKIIQHQILVNTWITSGPIKPGFLDYVRRNTIGKFHEVTAHNLVINSQLIVAMDSKKIS